MNTIITKTESINELHEEIEKLQGEWLEAGRPLVHKYVNLGETLIDKKKDVGWGNWCSWIAANLTFSEDQAQKYMKAANNARGRDLNDINSLAQLLLINKEEKTIKEKVEVFNDTTDVGKFFSKFFVKYEVKKSIEEWTEPEKDDLLFALQNLAQLATKLGLQNRQIKTTE